MKILIIDNHTKYLKELSKSFRATVDIVKKEDFKNSDDLNKYDLLIFSGGHDVPTIAHHPEIYKEELSCISTTTIPILGICLGAEIITYALGGKLKKLDRVYQGGTKIYISDESLSGLLKQNEIEVYECHQWGVDTLPPSMISCAYSDHGPEIIKHSGKPIIGIQFHPEVTQRKEFFSWILQTLNLKGE